MKKAAFLFFRVEVGNAACAVQYLVVVQTMLVRCPKNLDFTVFQKVSLSNLIFILSGSIILAQVLVPNADTVLRQLTQLNSVTMPMRYLWVFFAYFMLRKHTNKFEREYRFVKNNGVALGFGAWCFFVTAACCILGMYKQGDMYTTVLNVITPIVLVTLGLILPAIKKREGKSA